ncbi:cupin [Exiguobacterium sp. BMC-KP]|uniref:cupin n=1 Tax=Exiguobacterium sp. BMC-KP TaxID=1684312 RepID=UPI0006AA24CF|nr:cupin [Exiguobacterium sp. BMC-KP]KOP28992.1 cupin [Exiguobacterium sp. BMC-KP]
MQIYQFKKEVGKKITKFDSNFVMSRIMQTEKVTHIGCIHLEKDGAIGYHQAVVPQLLLIVEGKGVVRGDADEFISVQSGEAVFWNQGEWHETKTDTGLTAIVIESEELDTSALVSI